MIGIYIAMAMVISVSIFFDFVGHGNKKEMAFRESCMWSVFWVGIGIAFGIIVWLLMGTTSMVHYYSGYVMEKVLSIDNLVVFIAIFSYFGIKDAHTKHRILLWGIAGALVFRGIFVSLGTSLFNLHPLVQVVFGLIVLWSAYAILKGGGDEEEVVNYDDKWFIKMVKKFYPVYTGTSSGDCFFHFVNGIKYVTPVFLCMVAIEFSDIMFSFDSVPAVISITEEPTLVYAAIIMAILGLRALFFILDTLIKKLSELETYVGYVLIFVGLKLIASTVGLHVNPILSLIIVLSLLGMGVIKSLNKK